MTRRLRIGLFVASITVVACFIGWGTAQLPGFGRYPGPYGDIIDRVGVQQRRATDLVSAVNVDYRAIDTVGEEFILFTAATGVIVLLRAMRDERRRPDEEADPATERPGTTDLIRAAGLPLATGIGLLGVYVLSHGQLTPGGGFQGGVIVASSPVVIFLAGERITVRRLPPLSVLEVAETVGAGGFIAVGLAGLAVGAAFLQNVAPLGSTGALDSSGTIAIINAVVSIEVAAAVLLITSEFLEQALIVRRARGRREDP